METNSEGKEMRKHLDKMKPIVKHDVMISYDINDAEESFYDEIYELINEKRPTDRITKSNYKFKEPLTSEEIENLKTEISETFKSKIRLNESLKEKQTKVSLVIADNNLLKEEIIINEKIN